MPEIIDHLASLTGLRDRDTLDVSLAYAMRDLLAPRRVAIYRLVGDPGEERWLTRASLTMDSPAATADPAWVDLNDLPRAAERAEWLECLTSSQVISNRSESGVVTLFPMVAETGGVGVIEIETARSIGPKTRRLVFGIEFLGKIDPDRARNSGEPGVRGAVIVDHVLAELVHGVELAALTGELAQFHLGTTADGELFQEHHVRRVGRVGGLAGHEARRIGVGKRRVAVLGPGLLGLGGLGDRRQAKQCAEREESM